MIRFAALPGAAPFIATGIRLASSIAIILTISTGYLTGRISGSGIGAFIADANTGAGNTALVLAAALWCGVLGLVLNGGLVWAQDRLLPCTRPGWGRPDERGRDSRRPRRAGAVLPALATPLRRWVVLAWWPGSGNSDPGPPQQLLPAAVADRGPDVPPVVLRPGRGPVLDPRRDREHPAQPGPGPGRAGHRGGGGGALGLVLGRSAAAAGSFTRCSSCRALPAVTMVPVFIAMFRIGTQMEVATIVFGTIWPILLNTADGAEVPGPGPGGDGPGRSGCPPGAGRSG